MWRLRRLGAIIIALLVFGGGAPWLEQRARNPVLRTLMGDDRSTAAEFVIVPMGEIVLRIPRSYFLVMPEIGAPLQATDSVAFSLLVKLPRFQPVPSTDKSVFAVTPSGTGVTIAVKYKLPGASGKKLFDLRFERRKAEIGPASVPGFSSFPTVWDDEEMFEGGAEQPKWLVSCNKDDNASVRPYCHRVVSGGRDLFIEYNFARSLVGEMKSVQNQIFDGLNLFRIAGPALEPNND